MKKHDTVRADRSFFSSLASAIVLCVAAISFAFFDSPVPSAASNLNWLGTSTSQSTPSATLTSTATLTPSTTRSPTRMVTVTSTAVLSSTQSPTPKLVPSPSLTVTITATPTPSRTLTSTVTATLTTTATPTLTLTVQATRTLATVTGRYVLAGRNAYSGTIITASPGGYTTTTAVDGGFSLSLPAGTYTITASARGYLPTQKSSLQLLGGSTMTLASATAVAGDVDGNAAINTQDAAIVGNAFMTRVGDAKYDPRADINGDGVVNILDLIWAASRNGQVSAQVWP